MSELDIHLSSFLSLEYKRTLSLKMQEAGISTENICEVLSVSRPFVSKWKKKYATEGLSCLPVQYEGRPSYLSDKERTEIIAHISDQAHYSLSELVEYINSIYGVVFKSKQSYYDLLSAGGLSWHKTQKANPKKDDQAVLKKREEIKKNWNRSVKRLKRVK
jgi:putative transposase